MAPDFPDFSQSDENERPRRMRVPRSRRLTIDLLHYREKSSDLRTIESVIFAPWPRPASDRAVDISWSMIFIKAFGMVAARYPVLRQMYLPFPWPHIYQHPTSVAMVATHRDFRGEPWLFWSRFTTARAEAAGRFCRRIRARQTARVKEVFPWQLQLSGMPTPVRRLFVVVDVLRRRKGPRAAVGNLFSHDDRGDGAEIQHPPAFSDIECHLRPDRRKWQEPRDNRLRPSA